LDNVGQMPEFIQQDFTFIEIGCTENTDLKKGIQKDEQHFGDNMGPRDNIHSRRIMTPVEGQPERARKNKPICREEIDCSAAVMSKRVFH